jgi:hypothetical protein
MVFLPSVLLRCRRDYQPLVDFCKGLAALHNNVRTAAAQAPANLQEFNTNSNASGAGAPTSPSTNSSSSSRHSSMVRVIAANAPRRYVSLAGRAGREALLQLSPESQAFLAPLPYAQPSQAYVAKVTGSMRQAAADMQQHRAQQQQQDKPEQQQLATEKHSSRSAAAVAGEAAADGGACPYIGFNVSSNFLDAQCLWDSTMAHSIAQQLLTAHNMPSRDHSVGTATAAASSINSTSATAIGSTIAGDAKPASSTLEQQQQQKGPLVIHLCGKFHAEHRLGIPEHLQQYMPGARVLVVTFVPADSMVMDQQQLEAAGLKGSADFVVLTDGSLPRSFASVHPV